MKIKTRNTQEEVVICKAAQSESTSDPAFIHAASAEVDSCVVAPPFLYWPPACMHSTNGPDSSSPSIHALSPEFDLAAEARLEAEFVVTAPYSPSAPGFEVVLLTGATGFLGVHLLRDLLLHTQAKIVCLVRAPSPAAALARIESNLALYNLTLSAEQRDRVEPIPGDLGNARLGLVDADYEALAARVDTVFHSAAAVNFYQSYDQLRAVNVGGVREILRFALQARTKALHYVSSTGVFDSTAFQGLVVCEADVPANCHGSVMGYTQTKWVAEQVVLQARARGLPVAVYRSPFIMGDSKSGIVDAENLVVKMLIGCVQGGAWPDHPSTVEMVAVNDLSRAIVHLAQYPANRSRTFHLTSPERMRWADIGIAARSYGYPLESVPYEEWKLRLAVFGRRKGNALRPLIRFFSKVTSRVGTPVPEIFARVPRPIFDSTLTQAALAGAERVPAPMNRTMFATYLDFFVQQGWLPTPAEMQMSREVLPIKRSGSSPPYPECAPHA